VNPNGACEPGLREVTINGQYLSENESAVVEQMQKAAVRLANLLDRALNER
jgi:hypothetical protein